MSIVRDLATARVGVALTLLGLASASACAPLEADDPDGEGIAEVAEARAGDLGSTTQALSYGKRGFAQVQPDGDVSSVFAFNQAGGEVTSSRSSLGQYVVKFTKLGDANNSTAGSVQVVGLGGNPIRCKAHSFSSNGTTTETIKVACHEPSGELADSYFIVQFARPGTNSSGAYVLVPNSAASNTGTYDADSKYSWNSTGGRNRITRRGTGKYEVMMYGLTSERFQRRGHPKLSAFGNNPRHCNMANGMIYPDDGYAWLAVNCFDENGRLADSGFSLEFTDSVGVYDQGATVLADFPERTTPYTPIGYNSGHYGPPCTAQDDPRSNTVQKLDTYDGYYYVKHQSLPWERSTLHITAEGARDSDSAAYSAYCKPFSWWPENGGGVRVYVRCYTGSGEPVNAMFNEFYEHADMRTPC